MGCRAFCLVLLSLLAGSTYVQSCSLITSSVLRMDSEETFIIDGHGTPFDGDIIIKDFPKRKLILAQGRISVNNDNGFFGTTKFLIPSTNLEKDPEKKQFVHVSVSSGPCNIEKVVLVSYQSGYIHTDKPLYTPGSTALPSFELKLKADPKFYYITDREFKVKIKANYLYGKPVEGVADVLFSLTREGEKRSLPNTQRRIKIHEGEGTAVLKREDLVKYFHQEKDMLEWKLFAAATVITDSGGEVSKTELPDIHMVTSPYRVLYTKTTHFFKPGMPMDLMVFVTNPDGTPAQGVPVVAAPGSVKGSTLEDGTVKLTINTQSQISSLGITVTTGDPKLQANQQASAKMTATAYQTVGGNYLHLSVAGGELKVGESASISFIIRNTNPAVQNQITHFNYMVLNKGRIMRTGRQERTQGQSLVIMSMPITSELIPSFRVVSYYTVLNGKNPEIVADSVRMDVADTFKGMVWDSMEKYDTGCTAGGGADAGRVFYNAGLALGNSFHGSTPQRSESLCQKHFKRRRRETTA